MVVRTNALNSLKRGFLPQIHQPLPLTSRESRQLLDNITASFRKNLDKEHPWQSSSEDSAARPAGEEDTVSHKTTTDRHLRAILSNPLFAQQPQRKSELASTSASAAVGAAAAAAPAKDPYYVFHTAVSKGLMTTRRAAGFLATVRAQATKDESGLDYRTQLAATGAGLRVLKWLRASGQDNDLRFLADSALIRQLVPFMFAEGLEEVAWTWLAQLAASRLVPIGSMNGSTKVRDHPLFILLSAIVRETSQVAAKTKPNLDGSYSALLRADHTLSRDHAISSLSIKNAWVGLSWASTVEAMERPKPSVPLFESFVNLGRSYRFPLDLAHLELHHPTAPSPHSAVHYMHSQFGEAPDVDGAKIGDRSRRRLICLALDAADRLKQTGNTVEASWVERLLAKMCENLNLGILNTKLITSLATSPPAFRPS